MIDIIPTIANMLADIGTVELQFPDTTADFPVITLSEIANQSDTVLHGAERLSVITVQIDVWDKADTPFSRYVGTDKRCNGIERLSPYIRTDDARRRITA